MYTPYFSIELLPVTGWEASYIARPQLITSAIIFLFAVPEQAGEQQVKSHLQRDHDSISAYELKRKKKGIIKGMAVTALYACLSAKEPAQNRSPIKERRIRKDVYNAWMQQGICVRDSSHRGIRGAC